MLWSGEENRMIQSDDETPLCRATTDQLLREIANRPTTKCVAAAWEDEGQIIKWASCWCDVDAVGLVVKDLVGSVEEAAGISVEDILEALDDDDAA